MEAVFEQQERIARKLRDILLSDVPSAGEVVGLLLTYDGRMFRPLRESTRKVLQKAMDEMAPAAMPGHPLSRHGAVNSKLISHFGLRNRGRFPAAATDPEAIDLLPRSANHLHEPDLIERFLAAGGQTVRSTLTNPIRPAMSLLRRDDADLVVLGDTYITLERDGGNFVPWLSSRNVATGCLPTDAEPIDGHVVVLHDPVSSTNFAHMLFDAVARLVILAERQPAVIRDAWFLLSAKRSAMTDLVVAAAESRYGIDPSRFIFPADRTQLGPSGAVLAFSDQVRNRQRPVMGGHPELFRLTRRFLAAVPIAPDTSAPRILISRRDSKRRRVRNEAEIEALLASRGFTTVALGEIPLDRQIGLMRGAEVVIGPHGMGFVHIIFHPAMPHVLEFLHPDQGTFEYRSVVRAAGGYHDFILGRRATAPANDLVVEPGQVEAMLDRAGIR